MLSIYVSSLQPPLKLSWKVYSRGVQTHAPSGKVGKSSSPLLLLVAVESDGRDDIDIDC